MNPGYIFLLMTPFSFLFLINCIILVQKRAKHPFIDETLISNKKEWGSFSSENLKKSKFKRSYEDESLNINESNIDIGDDAHENLPMNWTNAKNVLKIAWWYITNLFLIYLFQYL